MQFFFAVKFFIYNQYCAMVVIFFMVVLWLSLASTFFLLLLKLVEMNLLLRYYTYLFKKYIYIQVHMYIQILETIEITDDVN